MAWSVTIASRNTLTIPNINLTHPLQLSTLSGLTNAIVPWNNILLLPASKTIMDEHYDFNNASEQTS